MPHDVLTCLSGGQSRALMTADVAVLSNSPIILIDEVENAGIDRRKAMDLLTGKGKIVLIVTHDPQLALLGEKRIVMKNGGMDSVIERSYDEEYAERLLDNFINKILSAQNIIREGKTLSINDLKINEEELYVKN